MLKKGLYDFDADHRQVRVFKGKADVFVNNQKIGLGDNRELTLTAGGKLKGQGYDERQYTDDFYRWSGLRAGYLAEADADTVRLYVNGGAGWNGADWYWHPWFSAYTFIPGNGFFIAHSLGLLLALRGLWFSIFLWETRCYSVSPLR